MADDNKPNGPKVGEGGLNLRPILAALRRQGNRHRAKWDARYHKSTLLHWGISTPVIERTIRTASRTLSVDDVLALAAALWKTEIWDCRIACGKLLGQERMPPSDEVWCFLTTRLPEVNGWAMMDVMARPAWKCLLGLPIGWMRWKHGPDTPLFGCGGRLWSGPCHGRNRA